MPTRPRLLAPGILYHVIVRGNQRQKTFLNSERRMLAYRNTRSTLRFASSIEEATHDQGRTAP